MKIGLYFGTYNPIHIGHLAIANYMVEFTDLDQVWFVVSPQSPHKTKSNLLDNYQRLEMVNRAIDGDDRLRASNIEFKLPKPSYTIDTLTYLKEDFPNHEFRLIMGSDNLETLHKWKNFEMIIENYEILVYPRPGFKKDDLPQMKVAKIVNAPLMEISSSFIRKAIREEKNICHFIPPRTWQYIEEMNFYK